MTKEHIKDIQQGVNYIKLLRTMSIDEIADQMQVTEATIHERIKIAREHQKRAEQKPETVLKAPDVKLHIDLRSGEKQIVKRIEVELLKEIVVNFSTDAMSEFTQMVPIRFKITRGG